jgi:hypothetical protein
MPLRDYFHAPVNTKHRWDAVHGQWPAEIVRTLFDLLPPGFVAEPQVYHPAPFEVDVSMMEEDGRTRKIDAGGGGTATLAAGAPTLTVPADLDELDEYEVRVYDAERLRTLVAAIEIVSPANKDRADTREQFVNKVAALLRQDVCVAIVDIVTTRHANFYTELLARLGHTDSALAEPPVIYAVTLRRRKPPKQRLLLDAWFFPLAVGQPLPTIPLWLGPDLRIELPLDPSYQEVCRLLRIS